MLFKTLFTATVAVVASFVSADESAFNPIVSPSNGQVVNVPKAIDITWTPTSSGNVNLILRKGGSTDLTTVATIATGIANSGTYKWTPSSDLSTFTGYTIQIVDASDSTKSNYSPYFTILAEGENWVTTTSGTVTSTSAASTSASESASSSSASSSESVSTVTTSVSTVITSAVTTSGTSAASTSGSTSAASTSGATSAASTTSGSHSSSAHSTTMATSAAPSSSAASSSQAVSTSPANGANAINVLVAAALSVVASFMPFLI